MPLHAPPSKLRASSKLILLFPILGLCFPRLYNRATPALFGFPFFYWYQFLWVILTSAILGLYYLRTRRSLP